MKELFKSKTVWAGLIAGIPHILDQIGPIAASGILGPKVQGITTGLGIILGAVGVKSAISKSK